MDVSGFGGGDARDEVGWRGVLRKDNGRKEKEDGEKNEHAFHGELLVGGSVSEEWEFGESKRMNAERYVLTD